MTLWRKMMSNKKKKKPATKDLLNDENVRRWYDNTSRGSKLNADIRLRKLNLFCHRTGTTPAKLVKIGKKDVIKIEDMLLDHVFLVGIAKLCAKLYRGNTKVNKIMACLQLY